MKPDSPSAKTGPAKQSTESPRKIAMEWIQKHTIPLVAFMAGLLIIAGVILAINVNRRQTLSKAFNMLEVAREPTQWEEIINTHPDTPAAPLAMLALASWHYHAGSYNTAGEFYEQFLNIYPHHDMRTAAELGLAMCREARGETDAAATDFQNFITAYPEHFLAPQAIFGQARCLVRQGDFEGARIIYEDFIAENPESAWTAQAEMALTLMQREASAPPPPVIRLESGAENIFMEN